MLNKLKADIHRAADPKKIAIFQRFFKTGKGDYGEGDVFIGLSVPQSRLIARKYTALSFSDIQKLLVSKIHEERLIALLILVDKFEKTRSLVMPIPTTPDEESNIRTEIYDFYLASTKYINNWDLVDLSADKIVGAYLLDKPRVILRSLARSKNLWERRIAMVATYNFIKANQFADTLEIAQLLLTDSHDLIQKSVGWMLREVGKRDQSLLEKFLKKNYKNMPRTALRYAIERFPETLRKAYLLGKI